MLQVALQGNVERKIKAFATITYRVGKERYGIEESKVTRPYLPSRREQEVKRLRSELRSLRKQLNSNRDEGQREALRRLRDEVRKKLQKIQKAERLKKVRKKKARTRSACIANPFKFTSKLLSKEKGGRLSCTKEAAEQYLQESHADPSQKEELGHCDRIRPAHHNI